MTSLLPLVALAILGRRMPHGAGRKPRSDTSIRGMLRARGVGRTLATSSLLQSGQDLFQFYLPVYAHGIGLSASAIGVVLAKSLTPISCRVGVSGSWPARRAVVTTTTRRRPPRTCPIEAGT